MVSCFPQNPSFFIPRMLPEICIDGCTALSYADSFALLIASPPVFVSALTAKIADAVVDCLPARLTVCSYQEGKRVEYCFENSAECFFHFVVLLLEWQVVVLRPVILLLGYALGCLCLRRIVGGRCSLRASSVILGRNSGILLIAVRVVNEIDFVGDDFRYPARLAVFS